MWQPLLLGDNPINEVLQLCVILQLPLHLLTLILDLLQLLIQLLNLSLQFVLVFFEEVVL